MAYRKVYLRIHTQGYSTGWSSDADRSAFKEESRQLFQELGWTIKLGHNGGCDVVTKDRQDLYLHPASFSGVLIVAVEGMLIICDTVIVEINVFVHVDTDLAGAGRTENVRYM